MIRTQERLKCFRCSTIPHQFVILKCYHLLCHSCLNHYRRVQSSPEITIVCSCGSQTSIQNPAVQILKSSKRNPISQFSISHHSSPKLKDVLTVESKSKLRESIQQQDTVDQTSEFSHPRGSSKQKKDSSKKMIKEIGCFTRLQNTQIPSLDEKHSPLDSPPMENLSNQMKFLQIQYQKSISEIRSILQTKIEELNSVFKQCQRNLRLWYSEMYSESQPSSRINLSQYTKSRYQSISKELDRLQTLIHQFEIKVSFKPTCFSPQHRRLKTDLDQCLKQTSIPKHSYRCSPSFQRSRSPQFICPHSSLMIQKHKFIKKKCNMLDYFI